MRTLGLGLMALFYLVVPLAQVIDYWASQPLATPLDQSTFTASILAYDWLLATIVLGLKLPYLQRVLPYDWRIRAHLWVTGFAAVFLAWHAGYTIVVGRYIDAVSWGLLAVFALLGAASLLWIPVPGFAGLRARVVAATRAAVLRSYDWLKSAHRLLYLVLAVLLYWHVLGARVIGVASPWSSLTFQGLFAVTVALVVVTWVRNLVLPTLTVTSVALVGGIARLTLARNPRLRYRSGQFAFVRLARPRPGGEEHPFSFTTASYEEGVGFALRTRGDFTTRLAQLKPGDQLMVNGGFGDFHPEPGRAPLALVGSGIGVAPVASILKHLGRYEPGRRVVCLLAVDRREELVEGEALARLASFMPNLTLKVFVLDEDGPKFGPELFARELESPRDFRYYLCSSQEVRAVVLRALGTLGVKRRLVHFEAFDLG